MHKEVKRDYNQPIMAFLFDKKTRNAMRWVWIFFSVIIILSMVLVFSGGSQGAFAPIPTAQTETTPEESFINAEDIMINAETESGEEANLQVTPIEIPEGAESGGAGASGESNAEFEAQL